MEKLATINEAFALGKKEMLEKAANWLRENASDYTWYDEMKGESGMMDIFIDRFIEAMEGK